MTTTHLGIDGLQLALPARNRHPGPLRRHAIGNTIGQHIQFMHQFMDHQMVAIPLAVMQDLGPDQHYGPLLPSLAKMRTPFFLPPLAKGQLLMTLYRGR